MRSLSPPPPMFVIWQGPQEQQKSSSLKSPRILNTQPIPGIYYSCNHQKWLSYQILDNKTVNNDKSSHQQQKNRRKSSTSVSVSETSKKGWKQWFISKSLLFSQDKNWFWAMLKNYSSYHYSMKKKRKIIGYHS